MQRISAIPKFERFLTTDCGTAAQDTGRAIELLRTAVLQRPELTLAPGVTVRLEPFCRRALSTGELVWGLDVRFQTGETLEFTLTNVGNR